MKAGITSTFSRAKILQNHITDEFTIGKIGIWGWRRREYLRQNKPDYYSQMLINGTLMQHLINTNQQATDMVESIIMKTVELENVTEELKRKDQTAWVRKMNCIRSQAEAFVKHKLINC